MLPGPAAELGLESVVATLQLKLLAAMPVSQRQRAVELSRRFHFDAPSWFNDGDDSPHLGAVADAVRNQQRIVVRYRSWENESTRTLEPYGLVLKGGRWYVAANTIDPLPDDVLRELPDGATGHGSLDRCPLTITFLGRSPLVSCIRNHSR